MHLCQLEEETIVLEVSYSQLGQYLELSFTWHIRFSAYAKLVMLVVTTYISWMRNTSMFIVFISD